MTKNFNNKSSFQITYKGLGLAIGLIFGGLIGLPIGNPIIFAEAVWCLVLLSALQWIAVAKGTIYLHRSALSLHGQSK